jgi:hypothetical protein
MVQWCLLVSIKVHVKLSGTMRRMAEWGADLCVRDACVRAVQSVKHDGKGAYGVFVARSCKLTCTSR